ncbi:MAG TPA: CPBP family glutamic-type intramembrane protease [Polyangiaceae bacterium]
MSEELIVSEEPAPKRSDPWSDLALTLPIFVAYHLGVAFLPMRNAADVVTHALVRLADDNLAAYGGVTLALGALFVSVLMVLGQGHKLELSRFGLIAAEGLLYAVVMRFAASLVVGKLHLDAGAPSPLGEIGPFAGLVMSLGAGFYEEIAFRVLLFGLGAKVIRLFAEPISPERARLIPFGWAFVASFVFSAWHYVGAFGDPFELRSFVFRWVCGLVFTIIYAFRGFAPAVWTHVIYDVWVLVF